MKTKTRIAVLAALVASVGIIPAIAPVNESPKPAPVIQQAPTQQAGFFDDVKRAKLIGFFDDVRRVPNAQAAVGPISSSIDPGGGGGGAYGPNLTCAQYPNSGKWYFYGIPAPHYWVAGYCVGGGWVQTNWGMY